MLHLFDPTLWFFILVGMVWVYRARRALTALSSIPSVRAHAAGEAVPSGDLVTVIIPAKNEESNIGECIRCLRDQDYPHLQLLVVNDASTDRTPEILREMGVEYLNAGPTPEGWTGKNYAIHCALPQAKGKWLLFTDADTRHEPQSVSSAVAYARQKRLEFLTLLPRCITRSLIEDFIQPVAMSFLGLWFPVEKVNNPKTDAVFGNGQYILIKRRLYEKLGGHQAVKGEFLEDYAMTRNVKKAKAPYQVALGIALFGTRMYDSFNGLWRGWRRIYLHAFERKPAALFLKFLNVVFFSVFPFLAMIPMTRLATSRPEIFGFSWGVAVVTLLFILSASFYAFAIVKAKRIYALLHPLAAFFVAVILLDAFWMALHKQKTSWR